MYGMLVFLFITVFIAGLMVGRTPEYLGKKIETREMQLSVLAVVGQTVVILFLAAAAMVTKAGSRALEQPGPARAFGNPLRLLLRRREQRQRIRRSQREHPFYNVTLGRSPCSSAGSS